MLLAGSINLASHTILQFVTSKFLSLSVTLSLMFLFFFVLEEKLQRCKECFQRSYGQNLERLTVVKVSIY